MHIVKNFANGYGVSAVDRDSSPIASASPGTVEVAVLHGTRLCYATPVTGDVLGYQTPDDLDRIIAEVEALPESPYCQHRRPEPANPMGSEPETSVTIDADPSYQGSGRANVDQVVAYDSSVADAVSLVVRAKGDYVAGLRLSREQVEDLHAYLGGFLSR